MTGPGSKGWPAICNSGKPGDWQDCCYPGHKPSYTTTTVDGTDVVHDNWTGLEWHVAQIGSQSDHAAAKDYCAKLGMAKGGWRLPGLDAELGRMLGVKVRLGNPLSRATLGKKVGSDIEAGSLAVAIGLGMEV